MENSRYLLSIVKQNIRNVMRSLDIPVATIWQFLDQYNATFKEPVPYQRLGFQNFNQFVASIADVVTMHFVRGELMLTLATERKAPTNCVPEEPPKKQEDVSLDLQPKVLALLNWYDKGIALSEFGQRYEKLHGKLDPPISQEKWQELLENMKIADVRENGMVFAAPPEAKAAETVTCQNDGVANSSSKKRTLSMAFVEENEAHFRKVLVNFKSGIEATKFPVEYQKVTNAILDYQKYGFSGIVDLATSLPAIFKLRKNKNGKGWLLFENKINTEVPERINALDKSGHLKENTCQPPAVFPLVSDRNDCPQVIDQEAIVKKVESWKCCTAPAIAPEDAVLDISELLLQTIPSDKKVNDNLEVYVSYVYNPGSIWLQLRGEKTSIALDRLMDELHACYNGPDGDCYKIPYSKITENLNVAIIYAEDGYWHRGIITKVHEREVDVFFFDYGNNGKIDLDDLRYLKAEFLKLPAQALPADLAFIAPLKDVWDPAVNQRILELTTNIPLVATIIAMNVLQTLSVVLCDTKGEDDIFINDVLIKEGLASLREQNILSS